MKHNARIYAMINSKELTLNEFHLSYDDFGNVVQTYSRTIIDRSECKKYVNPLVHFIDLCHDYLHAENSDLIEVIENKKYEYMVESFKNMVQW